MPTTTVTLTPDEVTEIWTEVFGSAGESFPWWRTVDYQDGADWNIPGPVTLGIEDPDDEDNTITKTVGPDDLLAAVAQAAGEGYLDACTGNPIHLGMSWDAGSSDTVMQLLVLGRPVYA